MRSLVGMVSADIKPADFRSAATNLPLVDTCLTAWRGFLAHAILAI